MKRGSKERLFEVMGRVNPDFKPKADSGEKLDTNLFSPDGRVRISFSDKDDIDLNFKYKQDTIENENAKPRGMWYSFDKKWVEYVRNNGSALTQDVFSRTKSVFMLGIDYTNIIVLNNSNEAEIFFNKYKIDYDYSKYHYNPYKTKAYQIDWNKVSADYKGIEIPDINSIINEDIEMKFDNWDVDSGCIWDLTAIIDYRVIKSEEYLGNYAANGYYRYHNTEDDYNDYYNSEEYR